MNVVIESRFQGPPMMGHGGVVAGLLARMTEGAVQVTLRRPIPLETPLEIVELDGGRLELRTGDELLVESEPAVLEIDIPPAPTLGEARGAESASPSHYNGSGVHPTCFGCGVAREDGIRVFAGPLSVRGVEQVAGVWHPAPFAGPDGTVDTKWVLAALDCPGAFAFISAERQAGLLGRIVFERYGEVRGDRDYVVTGWQIGSDGRRFFAGTGLFDDEGTCLAAARATWFPWATS